MIRFVDFKTGDLYNGDKPYVHWIEGEQSTSMIYTLKLGVVSDRNHFVVSLPGNQDVFKLVDVSKFGLPVKITEEINGFTYYDLDKITSYTPHPSAAPQYYYSLPPLCSPYLLPAHRLSRSSRNTMPCSR